MDLIPEPRSASFYAGQNFEVQFGGFQTEPLWAVCCVEFDENLFFGGA